MADRRRAEAEAEVISLHAYCAVGRFGFCLDSTKSTPLIHCDCASGNVTQWGDRWVRRQVSLKKIAEERRELGWIGQAASTVYTVGQMPAMMILRELKMA